MNEFVAVIILIVIFIIFNNLNTKIRRLEKEITDLNYKINKAAAQSEVTHKKTSTEETIIPQQVQSHQIAPEEIKHGEENEEKSQHQLKKTGWLLFLIF
ncbi:hypothetical protein [Chryseobacterium sp. MA9]|uniref:hypothetical protein n=1 Tax=Chryseobacterium sp. MA9 TaxID=2966625 RepID=UPI002107DF00|nr:hypothetical protein [Chryseobacterium sp. MA9]UTX48686.1 hypothetical protein KIK00_22825 [Chryseobacterium sp. MA9]